MPLAKLDTSKVRSELLEILYVEIVVPVRFKMDI